MNSFRAGLKHGSKGVSVQLPNISGEAFEKWVGPDLAKASRKGPKSYSAEITEEQLAHLCGVHGFGKSLRCGASLCLCAPVKMTLQVGASVLKISSKHTVM